MVNVNSIPDLILEENQAPTYPELNPSKPNKLTSFFFNILTPHVVLFGKDRNIFTNGQDAIPFCSSLPLVKKIEQNISDTENTKIPQDTKELVTITEMEKKEFIEKASVYATAYLLFQNVSSKKVDDTVFTQIVREATMTVGDKKPSFYNIYLKHFSGKLNIFQRFCSYLIYVTFGWWLPEKFISNITDKVIEDAREAVKNKNDTSILENKNLKKVIISLTGNTNDFLDKYNRGLDTYRDDKSIDGTRKKYLEKTLKNPNEDKKLYGKFSEEVVKSYIPKMTLSKILLTDLTLSKWETNSFFEKACKSIIMVPQMFSRIVGALFCKLFLIDTISRWLIGKTIESQMKEKIPEILDKGMEAIETEDPAYLYSLNATLCELFRDLKEELKENKIKEDNTPSDQLVGSMRSDLQYFVKKILEITHKEPYEQREELEKLQKDGPTPKVFTERVARKVIDVDMHLKKVLEEAILKILLQTLNTPTILDQKKMEHYLQTFMRFANTTLSTTSLKDKKELLEKHKEKELELANLTKEIVDIAVDQAIEEMLSKNSNKNFKQKTGEFYSSVKSVSKPLIEEIFDLSNKIDLASANSNVALSQIDLTLDRIINFQTILHNMVHDMSSKYSNQAQREIEIQLQKAIKSCQNTVSLLENVKNLHRQKEKEREILQKIQEINKLVINVKSLSARNLSSAFKILHKIEELISDIENLANTFEHNLTLPLSRLGSIFSKIDNYQKMPKSLKNLNNLINSYKQAQSKRLRDPTEKNKIAVETIFKDLSKLIKLFPKNEQDILLENLSIIKDSRSNLELFESVKSVGIIIDKITHRITTGLQLAENSIYFSATHFNEEILKSIKEINSIKQTTQKEIFETSIKVKQSILKTNEEIQNLESKQLINLDSFSPIPVIPPILGHGLTAGLTWWQLTKNMPQRALNYVTGSTLNSNITGALTYLLTFGTLKGAFSLLRNEGKKTATSIVNNYVDGTFKLMRNHHVYRGLIHSYMQSFIESQ